MADREWEQRRPYQEDGRLAVPDEVSAEFRVGRSVGRTIYQGDDLVGLMDTAELAERAVAAMNRPPQEPRTGGVLVRWDGGYGMFVPNSYGTQTHRVFPLAEAEALIDPNDPVVRDLVVMAVKPYAHDECANIADAVLAALRGKL